MWLYEEQFSRWQKEGLTPGQRQEVTNLISKLAEIKALAEKILALLNEIKHGTIDQVLKSSDPVQHSTVKLDKKQIRLAQKIDKWIKRIERNGGGDEQILQQMYEYMPLFKKIMDASSSEQMELLSQRYAGFYRFAKLLEQLAAAIRDGAIKVPK